MNKLSKPFTALLLVFFGFLNSKSYAQNTLNKRVSVKVNQKPLGGILKDLETKANFRFSYNSNTISADSLVSLSASNWTIKEVLNTLLDNRFEYREIPGFVILRFAPSRLTLVPEKVNRTDKSYKISGYVIDDKTGIKLSDASVYDKKLLRSTLTDKEGHFNLKIKTTNPAVALTISKEMYRDTMLMVLADVKVSAYSDTSGTNNYDAYYRGMRSRLARFLTSSRQRIQDANIGGFFANSPFQASLIPGLSSHGMMSSQVVNKVSVNAIGGYTAGVKGVELGGVFNISKKDVEYAQFAGVFNLVGRSVSGIQGAGVFNVVLDSLEGTQFAGISNTVIGRLNGVQAAGVINHTHGHFKGAQVAGTANFAARNIDGTQVSGVLNVAKTITGSQIAGVANFTLYSKGAQIASILNVSERITGTQISGLANISIGRFKGSQIGVFNIANKISGSQIGFFNIADSISGYSIGLLNFARKGGYHSISAYSSELQTFNLALKTGTSKFYTILQAGKSLDNRKKMCSASLGFGREYRLYKKLFINPEISQQNLYQGSWNDLNIIVKINPLLYFKPNKIISVFAGPSVNGYYSDQNSRIEGYAFVKDDINHFNLGKGSWKGWLGWSAGLSLF